MPQSDNMISAKGLITFSNELSVPEGALVKAENVNIDERGVITSRRGFNDYGTGFSIDSTRLKQIINYKDRLLRHYENVLEYDDGSGNFTAFNGSYSEIEEGFKIKYQETKRNLYFTTSDGIKKISISNNSQFAPGVVEDAGALKAYDISATAVLNATGFMPIESKVGYRVVFGTRDGNNNLLLGSPSSRFVVENSSAASQANADVEITLPAEITTNYFYQIYRTAPVEITGSLTLAELDPGDEMQLVLETPITSADITAGVITVSDITPNSFRESGAFLYTNEVTGEGILQANEPPPIAKDVTLFRNSMFYANTKTIHQLTANILSVGTFTAGTTEFIIGNDTTVRRYLFDTVEDVPNQQALLSTSGSIAQAIDETARSLVKVINRDPNGFVYARYLSGPEDLPGIILFEARELTDVNFYIATNDSAVTSSWSPELPAIETVVDVTFSAGSNSPANIQATGHGLVTGTNVYVYSPNTTPAIAGEYQVTVVDANNFTIPINITGEDNAGTNAFYLETNADIASDNLESPNRVYFSKTSEPEAVPIVNFIDVGPKDEPIERILALRDNLFILKTDGIYIVDGVTAPNFSVRLLESNTNLIAPDSAVILGNLIYCLSNQGVVTIGESTGASIISRVIENRILDITNSRFDFRLKCFGVAYESERSYHLWMPSEISDELATQCYRYNFFERAWSRWTIPATCGVVGAFDDKLYLGDGQRNVIQQERKNRDRTDYSDRNFTTTLGPNKAFDNKIEFITTDGIKVGDIVFQEQYITIAIYNRLLRKLDKDSGLTDNDYESTLLMGLNDNITTKLNALNAKLEADDDSGVITAKVFSTDGATLKTQYNTLVDELNDIACDTNRKNYRKEEDGTYVYETVITAVDNVRNSVTINYPIPLLDNTVEIYTGIEKTIQWSPQHFGSPSTLKQMREGTIIFDQNNFYSATVSYSTDLSAGFVDIDFLGKGVGFWGSSQWGVQSPDFYWGGNGNDVPFRSIIPKQKQRGRYLNVKYTHVNSREGFRILGISTVVRTLSSRAYR
jgi:hypothetical protein